MSIRGRLSQARAGMGRGTIGAALVAGALCAVAADASAGDFFQRSLHGSHGKYERTYDRRYAPDPRYGAPAYLSRRRAPTVILRAPFEPYVDGGSVVETYPRRRVVVPAPSYGERSVGHGARGRVVGVKRRIIRCRGYQGRPETFDCEEAGTTYEPIGRAGHGGGVFQGGGRRFDGGHDGRYEDSRVGIPVHRQPKRTLRVGEECGDEVPRKRHRKYRRQSHGYGHAGKMRWRNPVIFENCGDDDIPPPDTPPGKPPHEPPHKTHKPQKPDQHGKDHDRQDKSGDKGRDGGRDHRSSDKGRDGGRDSKSGDRGRDDGRDNRSSERDRDGGRDNKSSDKGRDGGRDNKSNDHGRNGGGRHGRG